MSARLLVNVETVAVGMTVAVLVFPLQCFLCFLFRKAHSQVTEDSVKLLYFHEMLKPCPHLTLNQSDKIYFDILMYLIKVHRWGFV